MDPRERSGPAVILWKSWKSPCFRRNRHAELVSASIPAKSRYVSTMDPENKFRVTDSVVHPPRRITARLARLVKEDDVAVGVAQPRLAPHPRLVARAVLERQSGTRQLLDSL